MSDAQRTVQTGHVFTIDLSSYDPGSTGFLWGVSRISGPIVLVEISQSRAVSGLPGGTVITHFTFFAAKAGTAEADFELIRPWGTGEVADRRHVKITVAATPDEALVAAAGQESFPAVLFAECEGENAGKVTLPSRTNCIQPYGVLAGGGGGVKYGFPITPLYNVRAPAEGFSPPIIAFYMAQPPR